MSKSNYTTYKDEIRDLRKLLNDEDYCAGFTKGFHNFLSEMHMKLVSNGRVTPRMINAIRGGIKKWKMFYDENGFGNEKNYSKKSVDWHKYVRFITSVVIRTSS